MFITPQRKQGDPLLSHLLGLVGGNRTARGELQPGLVEITHFSAHHDYDVKEMEGKTFEEVAASIKSGKWFSEYGVADSPEQALAYAKKHLADSSKNHCVFVTHITKDAANAGQGDGWRWHKWGEYIGTGTPTMEYLDDEPLFDTGVYVFHIYEVI